MWLRGVRRHGRLVASAAFAIAGVSACGATPVPANDAGPVGAAVAPVDSAGRLDMPRLVVLGDSLTAGLGLEQDQAFPARLQERLDRMDYSVWVVDAGVSGGTTAGAVRRLAWALDGDVRVLIVALGGNDGLRGLPVEHMKGNLAAIITAAEARGVEVLLAGMEAPPNFGRVYADAFRNVFLELAREYDVGFVPFLLEGVAGVPELNQADGIHPNAEGADRVAAHLWPTVETLVRLVEAEARP